MRNAFLAAALSVAIIFSVAAFLQPQALTGFAAQTVELQNKAGARFVTSPFNPEVDEPVKIDFWLIDDVRCEKKGKPYSEVIIHKESCDESCSTFNFQSSRTFGINSRNPKDTNLWNGFAFYWSGKKKTGEVAPFPLADSEFKGLGDVTGNEVLQPGKYCIYGGCSSSENLNDDQLDALHYYPVCRELHLKYNTDISAKFNDKTISNNFYIDSSGKFVFSIKNSGGVKGFQFKYPDEILKCNSIGFEEKIIINQGKNVFILSKKYSNFLSSREEIISCSPKSGSGQIEISADVKASSTESRSDAVTYQINIGPAPPTSTTTTTRPPVCTAGQTQTENCWDSSVATLATCDGGNWKNTNQKCPEINAQTDTQAPKCRVSPSQEYRIKKGATAFYDVYCEDYVSTKLSEFDHRNIGRINSVEIVDNTGSTQIISYKSQYYSSTQSCGPECHGGQEWKTKTFSVKAKDWADQESIPVTLILRVDDDTPPFCAISSDGAKSEIFLNQSDSLKVNIDCVDAGAGFDDYSKINLYVWNANGKEIIKTVDAVKGKHSFTIDQQGLIEKGFAQGDSVRAYAEASDAAYDSIITEKKNWGYTDYFNFKIKDSTAPAATIKSSSASTIFGGAQFTVSAELSDNAKLGKAELQVKKSTESTYTTVQTNTYSFPVAYDTRFAYNVPSDQNAITYNWRLAVWDAENNGPTYSPVKSFTAKPPCNVNKVLPTFSNVQPTSLKEAAPGETVSFSANIKNNYPSANKECGQLSSAFLKLDTNLMMEGQTTKTLSSQDQETVALTWKVPESFENLPSENLIASGGLQIISGGSGGLKVGGGLDATGEQSSGRQFTYGGGIFNGISDNSIKGVYPGQEIGWTIYASDASGNSNEIKNSAGAHYKIKIKDLEAPEINSQTQERDKLDSKGSNMLRASFRDWNINPPTAKIQIKEGSGQWKDAPVQASNVFSGKGAQNSISYKWSNANLPENTTVKWKVVATDAAGNSKTSGEQSFIVANSPYWADDRSPREAIRGQEIKLSKYWKDDTAIKEAMLFVDVGNGPELVDNITFNTKASKEGWIDFYYKIPRIEGIKQFNWTMKVLDIYDNEGSVDPSVSLKKDSEAPTYSDLSQQSNEVYEGWKNILSLKAKDNVELAKAEFFVKEGGGGFELKFTEQLSGTEASSSYEWENENKAKRTVEWFAIVKDGDGNEKKTETKKFEFLEKQAPVGITQPTTTSSTSTTTTTKPVPPTLSPLNLTTEQTSEDNTVVYIGVLAVLLVVAGAAGYYYYKKYYKKSGAKKPAEEVEMPEQGTSQPEY